YKKMERVINDLFEKQTKVLSASISANGLEQLDKLLDREYFTMAAEIVGENEKENIAEGYIPMSRMLTHEISFQPADDFIDKNNPPVFFINPEFMNDKVWL